MRDLARELGVSVVTVSNALNNRGSMSEETRERVLKTAMERGYRKDEFASINAAKRGTARTRHLVAFNARRAVERESVSTDLFRTIYFRVCRVLGQHDCDVVLTDAADPDCTADLAKSSAVIHLDEIPATVEQDLLAPSSNRVNVAVFFEHSRCISVMPDNDRAGRLAAEFLADRGHRHVVAHGSTSTVDQGARLDAFVRHFEGFVPDARVEGLGATWGKPPAEYATLDECFAKAAGRPTALFSAAGYGAILANKYFHERGIAVPGDVSLLGFDNFPAYAVLPVPIARFYFDATAMGDAAAHAVLTGLSSESFAATRVLVPIEFAPGKTVLPVDEMNAAVACSQPSVSE